MKNHKKDLTVATVEENLSSKYYDQFFCTTLISNLTLMKKYDIQISEPFREKLDNFTAYYVQCIASVLELDGEEFTQNLKLMALLLEFVNLDLSGAVRNLLTKGNDILTTVANDDDANALDRLVKFLKIMETLVTCTNPEQYREAFRNVEAILLRAALLQSRTAITYTMSLLTTYCKRTGNHRLKSDVWKAVLEHCVHDETLFQHYLTITVYLLESVNDQQKLDIVDKREFWFMLQKCLRSEVCNQKYSLYVLKYSVLNQCQSDSSDEYKKAHNAWWKTFFIIVESLDEKQTHLVLPMFGLLNSLANETVAKVDQFWTLMLVEKALKHDSRTVRLEAVLHLLDINVRDLSEENYSFTVSALLNAVNDSLLFRKTFKTNNLNTLKEKFISWMDNFGTSKGVNSLFKIFYSTFINLKWSPVPLLYTLSFLTASRRRGGEEKALDHESIEASANFVSMLTRYHNVKIRIGIQRLYIKFLTTYSNCDSDSMWALLLLTEHFNSDECLVRGSASWKCIVDYFGSGGELGKEQFLDYFRDSLESETLSDSKAIFGSRCMLLLYDACLLEQRFLQSVYSAEDTRDDRFKYVVYLFELSRSQCADDAPFALEMSTKSVGYICSIVESLLHSKDNVDTERLYFYDSCLEILFPCVESFLGAGAASAARLLDTWAKKAYSFIQARVHVYGSMKVISWIYKIAYLRRELIRIGELKRSLSNAIVDCLESKDEFPMCRTSGGKICSKYADIFWSAFKVFTVFEAEYINRCELEMIFDVISSNLDSARRENLLSIFEALEYLFRIEKVLEREALVVRVIEHSWKLVEESRSTPSYSASLEKWIQAFLTNKFLRIDVYKEKVLACVYDVLNKVAEDGGQSYESMIMIVNKLAKMEDLFYVYPDVIIILMDVFCVTHINRKDQRIENDTINYMSEFSDKLLVNVKPALYCEEMRLKALDILLRGSRDKEGPSIVDYCTNIVHHILSTGLSKKRYFNDSSFHRIMQRKLQLLLIFETVLAEKCETSLIAIPDCSKELFNFVVTSLLSDPHQPSVRYMLEWLLIRLLFHYPNQLEAQFWKIFMEASEERVGSICSFMCVAFHLANILKKETFVEKAVQSVLPWTMAQHFNARLYAQTVLLKLVQMNCNVFQKYKIVRESLECGLKSGNAVRNSAKMQQDFYFTCFHPILHFSLQTILWDLPRLSNISDEEWISPQLYKQFSSFEYDFLRRSSGNALSQFSVSSWIAKSAAMPYSNEIDSYKEKENSVPIGETQKKFIPKEESMIFCDNSELLPACGNLIVVASLIDRAPNLGGLTRTCEIFSVKSLIINNMDIMRHKEFTSLSITAEKHLHIEEVKRYSLFDYLKKMKEKGFCIAGAEQTSNSKSLNEFTFPSKTVLVLGNETEGIPANLLALLDVNIEIPQKGVIRSLNVHVSASLFIWEYAKQHLF